jgi:hypothetical protein
VPRGARALEVGGADPVEGRKYLFVHYHPLVGDETSTRVVVRLGTEIRGRLVTSDGTPLARATVRAVPQAWGFGPAETDADGRFRLRVLEGEEVEVRFDGLQSEPAPPPAVPEAGWRTKVWINGKEVEALVFQGDGSTTPGGTPPAVLRRTPQRASRAHVMPGRGDVELVARPVAADAELIVHVLAPDGSPEPDAAVTHHEASGTGEALVLRADAQGLVRFRGLARWPGTVEVAPSSYDGERRFWRPCHLESVSPGGAPLEVRLTKAGALRGRVLDTEGKPVTRAWCAALEGTAYAACFGTDAEGRFEVCSNVPIGTRVQVSARWPMESPRFRAVLESVVVGSGDLTIVLEPMPEPPAAAR